MGVIYNTLRPHSALSPPPIDEASAQAEENNEIAWSQLLVDRIVPLVLPPEDRSNPCLNVLVSEIFSQMILYNAILGKMSEPWMIWEGVLKVVTAVRPKVAPADMTPPSSPANRLEQYGLLSSREAPGKSNPRGMQMQGRMLDVVVLTFWSTLQQGVLIWTLLRSFATSLMQASSIQPRADRVDRVSAASRVQRAEEDAEGRRLPSAKANAPRPIAAMWIWALVGRLLGIPERMPWLSGLLSLMQWMALHGPGQVCRTNSALDR